MAIHTCRRAIWSSPLSPQRCRTPRRDQMLTAVKRQFEGVRKGAAKATASEADAVRPEETALQVVFVVTQSGNRANGGVESITQVLENLRRVKPVVVTQMETKANSRWRAAGSEVLVWPMPAPRLSSLLRANLRMYKLIRRTKCRVVHCNDILALWHTSFGARAAGASVVFNVRNI